ncbi:MAG: hypothetical protein WAV45_08130, partial [Propionibacteriaceae bacterium]
RIQAETQREVATAREEAARDHAAAVQALTAEHDRLSAAMTALVKDAHERSEAFSAKLLADSEELDRRRTLAHAEADQIRVDALAEASAYRARAAQEHQVARAAAEAEDAQRLSALKHEVEVMEQRQHALRLQLGELSAIAARSAEGTAGVPRD